jgi:subfamily B ATP-binding cassette protein MsbA
VNTLKRLLGYFKPYVFHISIGLLSALMVAAASGALAYIVKPTLDDIFINHNKEMLKWIPFMFFLIFASQGIFKFLQNYLMQYVGIKAIGTMRNHLYEKIIVLPMKFFSNNSTGILMSRITNDVNEVQNSVKSFINLIKEIITIIVLAGVVISQNLTLALYAIVVIPIVILPIVQIGKKIKRYSKRSQEKMGDLSTILQETFSGVKVVKSFVMEKEEIDKFKKENEHYMKFLKKIALLNNLNSPMMDILAGIGSAFVVFYGGLQVINGNLTAGDFFSFLIAVGLMYNPLKKINSANNSIQKALAAGERIFFILDYENEIIDNNGTLECNAHNKSIEFKNVYFKYEEKSEMILKNINFKVNPGQTVAFVGASGAGKTTLVNLIPRFFDVTEGGIYIGSTNIKDFNVYSLRRNIGIVSQEPFLFNGSIKYNIQYGLENASEEEIINAAKTAFAHDFIMEFPNGYDTIIGERGVRLSGGQKQRITIARALLHNPPILILDEATSALDTESEKIVQKALENLMKGRSSFVIAHRLSTILNADMIIVMNKGEIESIGTHKEILKTSPIYKKLFEMQFNSNV